MMRLILPTALLAMLLALCAAPAAAQDGGRLRVVGRGVVDVAPDFATVRVGVSTRAPAPTAAMDQNSVATRKIIDFAKKFGVQERDIQTDAVALSQNFKSVREPNGNMRQEPDGYQAINSVRITLRELPRLGTLMREVLDQGATNIGGVNFGSSEHEKAAEEARTKAVENAVTRAQGLAGAAKAKLGKILEITYPANMGIGDAAADLTVNRRAKMVVPIEAGSLQIIADVEMTWVIE